MAAQLIPCKCGSSKMWCRRFLAVFLVMLFNCWFLGGNNVSYAFSPTSGVSSTRNPVLSIRSTRLGIIKATRQEEIQSTTSAPEEATTPPPLVQRKYNTYLWHYNTAKYNINYRVQGPVDGPPVLLIHGFGATVNHFRFQFPTLAKEGYRVYAIDLLGFGASDKPKHEEYCIEMWIDLIKDFIQTTHSDKMWVIGGNSIGGLCSLGVSEQLSSLIRGCVLFNCSGGMTGFRYEELPWAIRPVMYFLQKVVLGPTWGGSFFENFKTRENVEGILRQQGVYGDQENVNEELLEILLGPSEDDGAKEVFLKVFAGPAGPTPESILPGVSCPILALWGDADPWTPVDGGLHPGTSFSQYTESDYQLHVLPGVGHCPHDENPKAIHGFLLPWMANLDKLNEQESVK